MQANYSQAYQRFESAARARHHVVDTYNFNPRNQWHQLYLKSQQIERAQHSLSSLLSNLFGPQPSPQSATHFMPGPASHPNQAAFLPLQHGAAHDDDSALLRQQIELSKYQNPF